MSSRRWRDSKHVEALQALAAARADLNRHAAGCHHCYSPRPLHWARCAEGWGLRRAILDAEAAVREQDSHDLGQQPGLW